MLMLVKNKLGVMRIHTSRFELLYPLVIIHFLRLITKDEHAISHYIMRLKWVKTKGLGEDEYINRSNYCLVYIQCTFILLEFEHGKIQ